MMSGNNTLRYLIHHALEGFYIYPRVFLMNGINVITIFEQKHDALNRNTGSFDNRCATHNSLIDSNIFTHTAVIISSHCLLATGVFSSSDACSSPCASQTLPLIASSELPSSPV